jgi:DNA-binding NtrC family response regulator
MIGAEFKRRLETTKGLFALLRTYEQRYHEAVRRNGRMTFADVERLHLERTLAATMQNKSLAAKLLGIDRSVLRRKLQRYGLAGTEPTANDESEADGGAESV